MHVEPQVALPNILFARYYGASLGRFLSVDPADDTNTERPVSYNKYAYVRNNPVAFTDPTGKAVLVVDMTNEVMVFIQQPEDPNAAMMIVPAETDVVSSSKPGAQDGFITYDVNSVQGAQPDTAYGPSGSYLDNGDTRGRDVHGGGSSLANPLASDQPLTPTLGCTRACNSDVQSFGRMIDNFKNTHGASVLFLRVGTPSGATHQQQTIPRDSPFVQAILDGRLQVRVIP